MISEGQLNSITYKSASKEEITERVIIPAFVPSNNIKAIDVTDLPGDERVALLDWVNQYAEYKKNFLKTMFNFEDWVEQTQGVKVEPKWRTFTQDRIIDQK
jgi:isopentenyldiphosphate isomerase